MLIYFLRDEYSFDGMTESDNDDAAPESFYLPIDVP